MIPDHGFHLFALNHATPSVGVTLPLLYFTFLHLVLRASIKTHLFQEDFLPARCPVSAHVT